MRRLIAVLISACATLGCDLEPEVTLELPPVEASSSASVEAFVGTWRVEAGVWSDCPSEWQRPMPTGETTWEIVDDHLVITAPKTAVPPAELWPVSDHMFTRAIEVSFFGCTATETLTLVVDAATDASAHGLYTAVLTHDGSEACQEMTREAALPERCETIMEWQAVRLSGL
ncbi:MAG: hypothetical protein ACPGU1_21955 [Myxococcota bacterium]